MENEIINYERRIVAFIDILGFKEIVKQSEFDLKKIELLYSILNYIKDWEKPGKWDLQLVEIEEVAQKKGLEKFDIRGKTNCTAFSDSIVISVQVDNNVNETTSTLVTHLAYIGAIMIEQGILIRGALTIGNIVHKENGTVFGQGLIDAYLLESKCAKYPRIILSDRLTRELNFPLKREKDEYPYHYYISRFDDGCVGFHQMKYFSVVESWNKMTLEVLASSLAKIRKVILSGLDLSFQNPEVFEKFKWLKEQYNKLLILKDYDLDTKTHGNAITKIKELNFEHSEPGIHYSNR